MKKLSYLVLFFLLAIPASAQNQFKLSSIPFLLSRHNTPKSFQVTDINKRISTIPHNLIIYNRPVDYEIEKDRISITAAGKTNLFNSPSGKSKVANAPLILFEPEADFTMSARVTGKLKSVYDVAALVIYQDDDVWAKFCYENSVHLQPTIVSVVTRTFSDDCNSMPAGDYAYMAVVKRGAEYSFFYSSDNKNWLMIRNFNLGTKGKIKVGFAAHGSRGDGFTGVFSEIKYQRKLWMICECCLCFEAVS